MLFSREGDVCPAASLPCSDGIFRRSNIDHDTDRLYAPDVTVLVPLHNGGGNVSPLVARFEPPLANRSAEVLFVDDSNVETPQVVAALTRESTLADRLQHQRPGESTGGLSGAVIAQASWLVLMDGDLQHPPEVERRGPGCGQPSIGRLLGGPGRRIRCFRFGHRDDNQSGQCGCRSEARGKETYGACSGPS